MFVLAALVYPLVLCALCLGAGLAVDHCTGGWLPAPLLVVVGAAGLIAVSQLTTYVHPLAPATPYLLAAVALAGFALEGGRARALARRVRAGPSPAIAAALAYGIALAPVLLAGRPTFSSFMALADSAVHMVGADFLMRHGMDYAHLDLRNSYGQFINDYYNTSYPSGADTLFGGSALLLRLQLIWAFQPFNAFLLASSTGPAWLLARRVGLHGPLAALAALTAVLPAVVYGYELLGSVKELTALAMILALGCLVVEHRRWLGRRAARAIPFALLVAAGVSALGAAFGAWALAAVAVLAVIATRKLRDGGLAPARLLATGAAGVVALAIAALPTWTHLSGSLHVAQNIASTSNPGNLHAPLRTIQVLGVWLRGSYKLAPAGGALQATHVLAVVVLIAAALGALQLLRTRAYALAGWIGFMLLAWLAVEESVTTWAAAKALMLTSPVVLLLAWAGVARLRAAPSRPLALFAAGAGALAVAGGVLVSDVLQYRASNLAPTARYRELASLNSRFAGSGPALFTDFDEYALYQLRDLDIGGPDFVYPPAALAGIAGGYGQPVALDRASPAALASYPLIITRLDPSASRPGAAYTLVWQGAYYQVWRRRAGAGIAVHHAALDGPPSGDCRTIEHWATVARSHFPAGGAELTAAVAPDIIRIPLARARHPARWGHQRGGLVMNTAGRLTAGFVLPSGGAWQLWVQGQVMPTVHVRVDGRAIAAVGGQLSGNSLVPDTVPPIRVRLAGGAHVLSVSRGSATLAPGDGGSAVLDALFLTPAAGGGSARLDTVAAFRWRTLCARAHQWVELLPPTLGA